jgi:hypothetical protein
MHLTLAIYYSYMHISFKQMDKKYPCSALPDVYCAFLTSTALLSFAIDFAFGLCVPLIATVAQCLCDVLP